MVALLLGLYSLLYTFLAWKKFPLALGLFIVLLPAYLIRFNIGPLPSTILELNFGIILLVWLVRYTRHDWPTLSVLFTNNKVFFLFIVLFLLASFLGVVVSGSFVAALGEWRAYFLEPVIVFLIILARREKNSSRSLIWLLGLSTLSISLFAILQKFTGLGIATPEWSLSATRRVTAFFSSPNAVGLYLGPIMLLLIAEATKTRRLISVYSLLGLTALTAILFTKSVGTWFGLAAGLAIFLWLLDYKKTVAALVVIGFIWFSIFNFQFSIFNQKSQSITNRLVLWSYTADFLSASPKNFIFGSGIRQFYRKIQAPHQTTNVLEPLIYPHNIFLNFWTETGLLGMIAFTGILYYLFAAAYSVYKNWDKILGAGFVAALTLFVAHGLIDVPYFKNDLAMLFWILAGIIVITNKQDVL